MHQLAFYTFTKTSNILKDTESNRLQYQGYLNSKHAFNKHNTPFTQKIFHLNTNNAPDSIYLKENLMLGKRVEEFFKLQISVSDTYEIVLENIQVQKEKKTIGELDFILKNLKTRKYYHIEVCYKFYLFDPNIIGDEIDKWIGPNRNDNLQKKIKKLSNKQFPLLYSKEAKEKIPFDIANIEQAVFFKTQLYTPYNSNLKKIKSINTNAICGYYISFQKFSTSKLQQKRYHIPKKQQWLIPPSENEIWESYDNALKKIKTYIDATKSILVWSKNKNGLTESLFITWW